MARRGLAGVAVMAALLAAPAVASAADLYVTTTGTDSANSCMNPALPCFSLQQAVNNANTSGDTIHIGPGTYTAGVASTPKNIDFEGAGAGTPTSTTGATVINVAADAAFTLTGGGTLRNLQVVGGSTGAPAALLLHQPGTGPPATYTLANVVAIGNGCSGCRAAEVRDTGFGDPSLLSADISASSFVATADNATSVFVQSANANFTRTAIGARGNASGGLLIELGTLSFTDGQSGGPALGGGGIELAVGGQGTITRSSLGGFSGMRLDGSMAPVAATVNDSLLVGTNVGASVLFGATLTARGSTFAAEGSSATSGVELQAGIGGDAVVNATGSIFRTSGGTAPNVDVKTSNANGHVSSFSADHSSYTTVDSSAGGIVTPPGSSANIAGDPGFANEAGGDFRLGAGSPLIDRGAPAVAGETDLTGGPRALDGNCDGSAVPDVGAFELARACPGPAQLSAPVLSGVRMTHRRFRVGKPGAARAPKGTRFVYTLSEPATVTITIQRRAAGRKKGHRCVKPRRGLHKRCTRFVRVGALRHVSGAGQSSVAFSGRLGRRKLAPGRYRATLVATSTGGRSKARRLSFTIVRR